MKPKWQIRIAKERIKILFDLAKEEFKKNKERAKRYVELARRIGKKYNVRLTKYKRTFCRSCNSILIPSYSSIIRIEKKGVKVICKECKRIYRYPYGKNR